MIGELPKAIEINGKEYEINTDFRVALTIFDALSDPDLTNQDKARVMLLCLFVNPDDIPYEDFTEACEKASEYLDGGQNVPKKQEKKPIISWQQDEQLIFAAVNRVAGREIRESERLHWWTFLGYFQEIDDKSLFSTVVQIRSKKSKGKKLEKWEQDFYKEHRTMVEIQKRYSEEEVKERETINRILNGGG